PREDVYLSTKNPLRCNTGKGWRERLETQLERLNTDHIDFYQAAHGLSWERYTENFSRPTAGLDEAIKAKEEGTIRHFGFSTHDRPEGIMRLIDTGHFEHIILQYNLLDRKNEEVIEYANQNGVGIIVMGPVGGGRLAAPSEQIKSMLPGGVQSSAEIALRFVLSNPAVDCAISGMNELQQVEENVATASRKDPLSDEEKLQVMASLAENRKLAELYCTDCKYCMPCPHDVNIPLNFRIMNFHRVYGLTDHAKSQYARFFAEKKRVEGLAASECQECGECEPKCPQDIPIIKQLKETHAALG
ncbi:MAG: aldo/keto reductase, partial [Armatimonadota bacterium]